MDLERDRLIKIIQSYNDLNRLLNFREIIVLIMYMYDSFSNFFVCPFLKNKASPKLRQQDGCGSDFSLFQKLGRLEKEHGAISNVIHNNEKLHHFLSKNTLFRVTLCNLRTKIH